MKLVIDASVAVKWFFHNKPGEQDVKQALSILQLLRNGEASAIQPPHWLVEAMSVFSREAPPFAVEARSGAPFTDPDLRPGKGA